MTQEAYVSRAYATALTAQSLAAWEEEELMHNSWDSD